MTEDKAAPIRYAWLVRFLVFLAWLSLVLVGFQFFVEPWLGRLIFKKPFSRPIVQVLAPEDTSVYRSLAEVVRENLQKIGNSADASSGFTVQDKLTPSVGSLATLISLDQIGNQEGHYGVGLAQADVLYHYVFGGHPELNTPRTTSNIRSMARMFDEWLFIGVPKSPPTADGQKPFGEEFVSEAKHVCVQEVGTGSMVTAINLGQTMQAPWLTSLHDCDQLCLKQFAEIDEKEAVTPVHEDNSAGESKKVEPSALCIKVRAPFEGSSSEVSKTNWHYLGIPESTALAMKSVFEKSYSIKPNALSKTYPDIARSEKASTTVAVDAVLVLSRDTPTPVVGAMQCLIDHWDVSMCVAPVRSGFSCGDYKLPDLDKKTRRVLQESGFCAKIQPNQQKNSNRPFTAEDRHELRFGNLPISRHGATIVGELDTFSALLMRLSITQLQGIVFILLGGFVYVYSGPIEQEGIQKWLSLHGRTIRRWAIRLSLFVAAHIAIATLIWLAESHSQALLANDKFVAGGITAALAWVAKYVATGNGDVDFQSAWAITCVASLKVGWGIAVLALGYDFQKRVRDYLKAERMKHHVIVIGWNPGTPALLGELTLDRDCIVIPFRQVDQWFSSGKHIAAIQDPVNSLTDEILRKAQFPFADVVVVVADHEYAQLKVMEVDSLTFRSIEFCRRFETETKITPRKRLIAEIIEPENVPVAESIGQRDSGSFDTLCTRQYSATFMAQVALKPALGQFFRELAMTKDESNELYMVQVAELKTLVSFKSFDELRLMLAGETADVRVVPIGIQKWRERRLRVNPDSRDGVVESRDEIAFLARNREQVFAAARLLRKIEKTI